MTQPAENNVGAGMVPGGGTDSALLRQLNAINAELSTATKVMAELLTRAAGRDDGSHLTSPELRSVGRRLVSAGGNLTNLGVEMGVAADQMDADDG